MARPPGKSRWDRFIGWSVEQRQQHLGCWPINSASCSCPGSGAHLASHLLEAAARRLSALASPLRPSGGWSDLVEEDRFAGTAYQAAGWLHLGQTTGRTVKSRQRTLQSPASGVGATAAPAFRQR
ncbi:MAG: DUF4338 domain-containing protein [Verrucomicrobiales bacterium]|nr:DUF4338 domain-containing protein [Verrucomicrobiales bacterium]